MAVVDHLYARCGSCGLHARQDYEPPAAMAHFGPLAKIAVVCAACGARRDYVMAREPAREREIQAGARRLALAAEQAAAAARAEREAAEREREEQWALLRAEMLGLVHRDTGGDDGA